MYKLLSKLLIPKKTYGLIIVTKMFDTLLNHYESEPCEIVEGLRFNSFSRVEWHSMADYIGKFRKHAKSIITDINYINS